MGVAFMVMFPVLYTDVTDSWKLRSRRQRLLIGGAGLLVELSIASFATFLWAFLPEGNLKSIAFVAATISWIMSVAINLNPLMRFDGYYLMSDGLGIANLQSRAFAVGRWRLREILFNLGSPPPELLPARTLLILTFYAWAIWVYRFFLFLGIALVVYTYFFKVLGVFLFAVEIIWFIARPLWSELKEWYVMKKEIFSRFRVFISLAISGGLIALVALPVSGRVDVPVVVEPAVYERIFPPLSARLVEILAKPEQQVKKGDVLFRFTSDVLQQQIRLSQIKANMVKARLARVTADKRDKSKLLPLRQSLAALQTRLAGFGREQKRLIVRAPISGRITDINLDLHIGRWMKNSEQLASISQGHRYVAKGYLHERDLWRVKPGDQGEFVPDDFLVARSRVSVNEVSTAGSDRLDLLPLTSIFGGKVASRKTDNGVIVPVGATYKVTMTFQDLPDDTSKVTRGVVHVEGRPESVASRIWRQVLRVLVRESGA
jgi:putative peptide zinc metalloprotease protein